MRALYGLKSSGAAFRAHLCKCMKSLGYTPCLADPDLWLKPEVDDRFKYYAYILCYVDDIMVIHHNTRPILDMIDKYMTLKESSVGDPDLYLGAKLRQMKMPNGIIASGVSPSKYVQEAVRNCEDYLKKNYPDDYELTKYAPNPFPMEYEPSMDTSALLVTEQASYYQSIIGVLRWIVELGRVDIATDVSQLSSFLSCQGRVIQ